ncbi:hypothetical protein H5A21_01875 [Pectobacterium aquaticum]|nr:hypothetical protein [Pectobacterium aquaticum]MBN3062864.1 hypothetical protein [Pectobacterium aquaticum]
MNNLKNVLGGCDIFVSGEFLEFRDLNFYPTCGLHSLVIRKMIFGCETEYSIFIPAADWEYVGGLGISAGDEICIPVKLDFIFDISHPLIWLSDRHPIVKK